MSVLLTAKFSYISTLIYSASYLKLTVKLMSGFEMRDIKNYVPSVAEKIQVFNKEWPDKCCLAFFFLFKYTQPVWSKKGEGISLKSFLSPFSLSSHTQQEEKDLQEGVSRTDSILLLLSHCFMLNWLLKESHSFEMCFGQTLYLAQHVCLVHTLIAGRQLGSGQEIWLGS